MNVLFFLGLLFRQSPSFQYHPDHLIDRAWVARRVKLDQCLELQLFNRDCETAEAWMESREAFIKDDEEVTELSRTFCCAFCFCCAVIKKFIPNQITRCTNVTI